MKYLYHYAMRERSGHASSMTTWKLLSRQFLFLDEAKRWMESMRNSTEKSAHKRGKEFFVVSRWEDADQHTIDFMNETFPGHMEKMQEFYKTTQTQRAAYRNSDG